MAVLMQFNEEKSFTFEELRKSTGWKHRKYNFRSEFRNSIYRNNDCAGCLLTTNTFNSF